MDDWITDLLETTGYAGVALLMLLENVVPPIPSEVVMPYAGYVAATGDLALAGTIAAGTAGSVAGTTAWYALGRLVSHERARELAARHGAWLTVTPDDVDRALAWFDRYGAWAVLIGRLIPGVRTIISLPAGLSAMPLPRFLLFTVAGTTAWTALLATGGFVLGQQWRAVGAWIGPVANVLLAAAVAWYVVRVVRMHRRRRRG